MPIRSRDPLYHSFWAGVFASGALHVLVVGVAATAALLDIALPFLTIENAPSRQIVLTASFTGPRETEDEQRVWVELTDLKKTPRDDNEPTSDPESSAADVSAVYPSKTADDVRESNNLGQFVKQRVEAAINEGQIGRASCRERVYSSV